MSAKMIQTSEKITDVIGKEILAFMHKNRRMPEFLIMNTFTFYELLVNVKDDEINIGEVGFKKFREVTICTIEAWTNDQDIYFKLV